MLAIMLEISASMTQLNTRVYAILETHSIKEQGRNMVYPGPIDPYFHAVILIPEPHFPQNLIPEPW